MILNFFLKQIFWFYFPLHFHYAIDNKNPHIAHRVLITLLPDVQSNFQNYYPINV